MLRTCVLAALCLAFAAPVQSAQTTPAPNALGAPAVPPLASPLQHAGPIAAVPAKVNFGVVKPDELLTATVKLVNSLSRDVKIIQAVPSCQCTGLDIVGKTIPANGELDISLSMKMSKAPVVKVANVKILFDGGLQQVLVIDLQAEVAYAIRATPPYVDMTNGLPLKGTYTVHAVDKTPFRILGVSGVLPVFKDFDPAKDAPRSSYVIAYDYTDTTKRVPPYLIVETDRADCPLLDLRVRHATTKIQPVLRVAEFRSSFGRIAPGAEGMFDLEIEKMGSQRITGVKSLSDVAVVELVDQVADGTSVLLKLRVKPKTGATGLLFFPIELTAGALKSPHLVFGLVR
ncbi:MAG: DUF1573 domain-containing protein [Phycisphaerae bacterium]|nr:DUF1573 domain-containing protein [Phycisphaerae bacterium]